MNIKRSATHLLYSALLLWGLFSGCIDESTQRCVQGFKLSFYTQPACQSDSTYLGQVDNLVLYIFDEDNLLVGAQYKEQILINKAYSEEIVLPGGEYTVVAWSGIGVKLSQYEITPPRIGVTRKDELLFSLKRTEKAVSPLLQTHIYVGESAPIYIPAYKVKESEIPQTGVNLLEITNRLTVEIEGITEAADYELVIEAKNGSMHINGTIAPDEVIEYEANVIATDNSIKAEFTLLKIEDGYDYTAILRNKVTGKSLYKEDLIRDFLKKNPLLNLACDHDFSLYFKVRDLCDCNSYTAVEIWVNNWLVYSYDTAL